MFYELETRLPPRVLPIWAVRQATPFMAFNDGQFIDQPGGGPFRIDEVRHTFDMNGEGKAIQRTALVVSE